ncbi:MAG: hypothetical protein LUF02_10545 [Erysipelotrichaceae bacterium]|nr:hypothetical protein [Erysipelotrichaceae bacterium]
MDNEQINQSRSEQEFKPSSNLTVRLFVIVYWLYAIYILLYDVFLAHVLSDFYVVGGGGLVITLYMVGFRPYRYIVGNRTVTYRYLIRKNKEINLMNCETIMDPQEKFTSIIMRARAIELYDIDQKKYKFFPKDRVGFVDAILKENRRIHCNVQDYTDSKRELKKRERRQRKRERRRGIENT